MIRKILFIAILFCSFFAEAQTPSPLYIPNNPDSILHVVNVNGVQRRVYNIDLLKMQTNSLATEQRVSQMISDSLSGMNLSGYSKAQVDSITAKLRTEITTGGSGLSYSNFILDETPSGSINSSNVTFSLANTPSTGTVTVYLNGLLQQSGNDYTISGGTITYIAAPITGDVLLVNYIK